MRKITKVLALCAMISCIPIMAHAAPEQEAGLTRYASDSNAEKPNEPIKIQELKLSITCTKPNENMSADNLLVNIETEHCHVDKIDVVRYNEAIVKICPDDGYKFSSNIKDWIDFSGNGIKNYYTIGYRSDVEISIVNNASFEPSDGDTFQITFDKYVDKLESFADDIKESDVKMSDANTIDSVREYIKEKMPKPPTNEIEFDVTVDNNPSGIGSFRPAVAGTSDKIQGTRGSFSYGIRVWKKNDKEIMETVSGYASILPTKYTSSGGGSSSSSGGGSGSSSGGGGGRSSSGSSSGGSNSSAKTGLNVSKPSVTGGIWENVNGKWKLKAADGSYASSQWASLNGKWYLFGTDGMMQTNWQMVNGKWYLLGQDGSMLIGWQFINDKWYFLGADGAMLSATITPDGYTVNENGEWVQ